MNYLHDEQHYIDRYDLHNIEECLDTVKNVSGSLSKSFKENTQLKQTMLNHVKYRYHESKCQ